MKLFIAVDFIEEAIKLAVYQENSVRLTDAKLGEGEDILTLPDQLDRITSYNVCYTKLLRALHRSALQNFPDRRPI